MNTAKLSETRYIVLCYESAKKDGVDNSLAKKKFFTSLKRIGFVPLTPHRTVWLCLAPPDDAQKVMGAVEVAAKAAKVLACIKMFNFPGEVWKETVSVPLLAY